MNVGFLTDKESPVLRDVVHRLASRGITAGFVHPSKATWDLNGIRPEHDLYILKVGAGPVAMTLAEALHHAGAETLNRWPAVAALRNKAVVAATLRRAGVPVPETWLAAEAGPLDVLLAGGPLIVKPYQGSQGRGVAVADSPAAIAAAAPPGEPLLAQQWLPGDGPDRKLFVIGDQVHGVLRQFPWADDIGRAGRPFEPDQALRGLARRVADALGLEILSIDVVVSGGRPWVVDVSSFGSFVGVPAGPRALADHIEGALRRG